jgi:Ion channel
VRRPAAFSPVWWQQWGLAAMLAFLVLALFVGAPLRTELGQLPFDLFFSLVLASGVIAFSRRRWLAGAVAVSGVIWLALRWSRYRSDQAVDGAGETWLSLLTLLILTGLVLEHVFREGPITADRVRGAVAAIQTSGGSPLKNNAHFAYFSFVTLTTLGYGDTVPILPVARALAIAEALVGQLYPAILIARLVSLQISAREGR